MKILNYFNKIQKKSIYISWLFSYVIIVFVFVIGSFFTYFAARKIILNEINSKSIYILNQIQNNMNNIISDISNLGDEFILNDTISNFSDNPSAIDGNKRYDASVISKLLNRYKMLHSGMSNILDIYIYIPQSDFVLSSRTSTDTKSFYDLYFKSDEISFDEWKNIVVSPNSAYKPVTSCTDNGDKVSSIMFTKPLTSLFLNKSNSYLVVLVNSKSFTDEFERLFKNDNAYFYIIDSNNQIICNNNNSVPSGLNYDDFLNDTGMFKRGKNVYAYTTDTILSWKFISSISSSVLFKNVSLLLKIQLILLLIVLTLVILLIMCFTKHNYTPIADILSMIELEKKNSSANPSDNEYEYIEKVLLQTFSELKQSNSLIENQSVVIQNSYFQRLLHGYDKDTFGYNISAPDIDFVSDSFLVCTYYIDDCSELFFETGNTDDFNYKQSQFIISNVIFELMNENHVGYIFTCDNMLTSIFNADMSYTNDISQLMNEIINKAQQFAIDNFNLYFSVALSIPCTGVSSLHNAYTEAVSVMEFKVLTCNTDNLTLTDMQQSTKYDYNYSNMLEQRLIDAIKSNNVELAKNTVDEIFDINFNQTTPTLPFIRCLIFDITSTIIKSINEISTIYKEEFVNNYNVINEIMNCKTIDEFKTEITKALVSICDFIASKNKINENKLETHITDYVNSHYSEVDLSIGSIADYLNLSPNYVSALFKSQTGKNLLGYITNVRIQKSLELLKQPDLKIKDISEMVGYASVRTFLSVFKKIVGTTPTQYRENNL